MDIKLGSSNIYILFGWIVFWLLRAYMTLTLSWLVFFLFYEKKKKKKDNRFVNFSVYSQTKMFYDPFRWRCLSHPFGRECAFELMRNALC